MNLRMILALALIALSQNLFAYTFTTDFNQGFYWSGFPIKISKFVANDNDGQILDAFVSQAENEWENAVGTEIWEVTPGYSKGGVSGNNIRWSNNFAAETGYDPVGTLAVAIRYHSGTYISKTEIILNGEMWALKNNMNNMLYTTILHELGHTIGIGHSDEYAVMYPSLNNLSSLTQDDAEAVNAVISESQHRQSIGYVSPFTANNSSDSSKFAACGSIGELTGVGGPRGGFFLTTLLGFILCAIAGKVFPKLQRKVV